MSRIYRSSDLRTHRKSIAGQVYTLRKRVSDTSRQIIDDPIVPLANFDKAHIIVGSLRWYHEVGRAKCLAYVVMPDHFHWMFQLGRECELFDVVGSVAKYTALRIDELMGWTAPFWQNGYHEHAHRTAETTQRHLLYLDNPVRAGFVERAEDWPYCETHPDWSMDRWEQSPTANESQR